MNTQNHSIVFLAAASLALAGCSTISIPPYSGEVSAAAQTRESQGLVVTADPLTDDARAREFFREDLKGIGAAVVYLKAENRSPDAAWLLRLEDMHLADASGAGGPDGHGEAIEGDFAAANAVGTAGAVLISFPMMFASAKLTSDALVKQKNYIDKEWRNQTLSPGQSAEGFVYFHVPPDDAWSTARSLRLDCLNVRNQQTLTLVVPLQP